MTPQEIEALRSEALKDKVEALSDMVEILKAERDALAAQVNALMDAALDAFSVMDGSPEKVNLCAALRATPQQCLRDVQAEAGRWGYIEGRSEEAMLRLGSIDIGGYAGTIKNAADQYAAKVRRGGAE